MSDSDGAFYNQVRRLPMRIENATARLQQLKTQAKRYGLDDLAVPVTVGPKDD